MDDLLPLPDVLKQISHEVRWNLVQYLSHSDERVQDLVGALHLPQNLVSYHLKQLRRGHLVTERRSSADGRDMYYSLDLQTLRQHFLATGAAIHPVLGAGVMVRDAGTWQLPSPSRRILFLCTKNSARSQIAEGLLRHLSGGHVMVESAGSTPTALHPAAVHAMAKIGIDISQHRSKYVDEVTHQRFDLVVTVCDRMREVCPSFPGAPRRIHWSIPDPVETVGSDQKVDQAFAQTVELLAMRVNLLLTDLEQKERSSER
ncbi:arsenate reductase/protein-tyrosine-phosphatase family protein [Dictyobacter arantiisoli]|uniref:ArsR family transcriptional regulator n=1 Tax=Dictyobacter arantiisoli TaxID=2014874 RepID=A0A5A5T8L2_9CHLR|nr:ArsR family transcriptional regulator [Dictyobacter arantiisoli]GCF07506.1 ArsR family transcriptional regulator [Dictyobacter arantiisoli]